MSIFKILSLIALATLSRPALAVPRCDLELSASNINLVWSAGLPTQQITFTVRKDKPHACDYFVTFSRGNSSDYNRYMTAGQTNLSYQLYKEASLANVLKELPDVTTGNEVISGSFGSGKNLTQSQTFYLSVPYVGATTPTLKPSGNYTDTFVMKLYRVETPIDVPEASVNVNVATVVPKDIQLSLVASGASFNPNDTSETLNFGTLETGASRGFDLRVLSNAGYAISFSSQNNGVLKHANAAVTTTVPYTLTVNGSPKNLSSSKTSPITVATGSGQTTTQGVANPIAVTIGAMTNAMAGTYSDVITVTAATTE